MPTTSVPYWGWVVFGVIITVALGWDLFLHRHGRVDSARRAIAWSIAWVVLALLFNLGVAIVLGGDAGEEFLSAYLLEKSLSIDNLFVFLLVFQRLGVPAGDERHVLSWGIFGAMITRGIFIALGTALLEEWHSVTYVFGVVLIVAAIRMMRDPRGKSEKEGGLVPWLQRHIPVTSQLHGTHFFVRDGNRRLATPLFLALVTIELTDIVFAVDSIPAAFAVTERPFIVYSSNVFAIFGLRSLYVVISRAIQNLEYLNLGLAAILLFAGAKMILAHWVHVPSWLSLLIIAVCGAVSVVASLWAARSRRSHKEAHP